MLDSTSNMTLENDFGSGTIPIPILDFPDSKRTELGYVPGDLDDQYLYVYPEIDETRRVVKRLENETVIGSTLTYMNGSLWRFNLASYSIGPYQDFVRINPVTGNNTYYGNDFVFNPRGLANDGQYFWVSDLTFAKIFKFTINSTGYIELLDSFDVPYLDAGSFASLACDGTFIYSVAGAVVYKINMTGALVEEVSYQGAPLWGTIVWTGSFFWADSGVHLTRWHPNWTLAGSIYPVAWGTDALAWDGTYLWSNQKTCELWQDGKMFQIEIVNDQLIS